MVEEGLQDFDYSDGTEGRCSSSVGCCLIGVVFILSEPGLSLVLAARSLCARCHFGWQKRVRDQGRWQLRYFSSNSAKPGMRLPLYPGFLQNLSWRLVLLF